MNGAYVRVSEFQKVETSVKKLNITFSTSFVDWNLHCAMSTPYGALYQNRSVAQRETENDRRGSSRINGLESMIGNRTTMQPSMSRSSGMSNFVRINTESSVSRGVSSDENRGQNVRSTGASVSGLQRRDVNEESASGFFSGGNQKSGSVSFSGGQRRGENVDLESRSGSFSGGQSRAKTKEATSGSFSSEWRRGDSMESRSGAFSDDKNRGQWQNVKSTSASIRSGQRRGMNEEPIGSGVSGGQRKGESIGSGVGSSYHSTRDEYKGNIMQSGIVGSGRGSGSGVEFEEEMIGSVLGRRSRPPFNRIQEDQSSDKRFVRCNSDHFGVSFDDERKNSSSSKSSAHGQFKSNFVQMQRCQGDERNDGDDQYVDGSVKMTGSGSNRNRR